MCFFGELPWRPKYQAPCQDKLGRPCRLSEAVELRPEESCCAYRSNLKLWSSGLRIAAVPTGQI